MTGKTSIEWATAVWNPTTGCTRVSAGCDNCYAFALHDKRYKSNLDAAKWFQTQLQLEDATEVDNLAKFASRDLIATVRFLSRGEALPFPKQYDLPFSRVQLLPDRLDDPLRHRKPERYFVDSMADLFHEDVPDDFLEKVWDVMGRCIGRHTFLVLTKRPERMRSWVSKRFGLGVTLAGAYVAPYPNVWLGTSVEDQAAADERIPHLLATPAAVRFLSCEPLLGRVDLAHVSRWRTPHKGDRAGFTDALDGRRYATNDHKPPYVSAGSDGTTGRIDWVIVGGESGPRARPMDLAWARSLVAQCRAAGVAVFVKQLGPRPYAVHSDGSDIVGDAEAGTDWRMQDRKGGDMDEWPEDLRVREFPR